MFIRIGILTLFLSNSAFTSETKVDIIGGRVVEKGDWPAIVNATFQHKNILASCSATIIGRRTLILAALCIDGPQGSGVVKIDQKEFEIQCSRHPLYPDLNFDLAICKAKSDFGVTPESILFTPYSAGDQVYIFGYGCTTPNATGGNDGQLRVGAAKIETWTDREFILRGSALCFYDSGGPAVVRSKVDTSSTRKVLGVMSSGNIKDRTWVSWLGNKENKKFIVDWAEKNGEKICGLHLQGKDCSVGGMPGEGEGKLPQECKDLLANNSLLLRVLKKCLVSEVAPKEKVCDATFNTATDCFNERF